MSKRKVRLFLPSKAIGQSKIEIVGEDFNYLSRVHRLVVGDRLCCFDGEGIEADAVIENKKTRSLTIKIIKTKKIANAVDCKFCLAQAFTKAGKTDDIIRKATELGVSEVIPFIASRSIGRLGKKEKVAKVKRWQKIAVQAARQSERFFIPKIHELCSFEDLLTRLGKYDFVFFFWEDEKTKSLKHVLRKQITKKPGSVAFCIGPEGGFTPDEVALARKYGFITASLGPRILRTETASLAALSILQYEFGN